MIEHAPPERRRCGAFTLAELLIATGITVVIVVMLGLMLTSLLSTASHATERVDSFRDARAALQMIERDLRNLVRTQWSPDPFTNPTPLPCQTSSVATTPVTLPGAYFALDSRYADPAGTPIPLPDHTSGNGQLYALIADTTTASQGDVCAVGYYCRWDDQLHAYTLRRFFRSSGDTLAILQGAGSYAADSVLYTPSGSDALLAAYVWNFTITVYDVAGNPYTTYPCICDTFTTAPIPNMLPAAIEVSFNAMSPQAARAVMAVTANNATAYNVWMAGVSPNPSPPDLDLYHRLIAPHMYQFRSRINLP
jgi:type II secretory pathway pseudopilin PulG